MAIKYISRMINLERCDFDTVQRVVEHRGLGGKGFSAALRMIIREWEEYQEGVNRSVKDSIFEVLEDLNHKSLDKPHP